MDITAYQRCSKRRLKSVLMAVDLGMHENRKYFLNTLQTVVFLRLAF